MIYELLSKGEQNARTAKELARATKTEVREVMQIIRAERLAGLPICSTCKGFFLPTTKDEIKTTIKRLYMQAKETERVADAMEKFYKNNG